MKKRINKILFAAQDPGGFNCLMPVIKELKKKKIFFQVILANESRNVAKNNNIDFIDGNIINQAQREKILNQFNFNCVVVGTSDGFSLDKKVTQWAKKKKIPTVSVTDFWSVDHRTRFSSQNKVDLNFATDVFCVIDQRMKNQMIQEGFNPKKILITGNPFFSTFNKKLSDQGKFILFVCQPFTEVYDHLDKISGQPFFNEIKIFEDYLLCLKNNKINLPIIIALHPRCKRKDKFNFLLKNNKSIRIAKKETSKLIKDAKLVLGINSIMLFEAAMLGKRVVSFQPGINKKNDILITNHIGLTCNAYNFKQLNQIISKCLKIKKNKIKAIREKYVNKNSINKVISAINNHSKFYE